MAIAARIFTSFVDLPVSGNGNAQCLERLQNRAMQIILHADRKTCTQNMRAKLFLLSLYSRRFFMYTRLLAILTALSNS